MDRNQQMCVVVGMLLVTATASISSGVSQPVGVEPTDPAHVQAQGAKIPITLVLVDSGGRPFRMSGEPAILRRHAPEPLNLILFDPGNLNPRQLTDAVFSLLIMQARDPEGHRRDNRTINESRISEVRPVYTWAQGAVQGLRVAPEQVVPGIGRHRVLQLWLPPLRAQEE